MTGSDDRVSGDKVIVSFDVRSADGPTTARVKRLVHGYTLRQRVDGRLKRYVYKGLKDLPGSVLIGQSVIALEPAAGRALTSALEGWGVAHRAWRAVLRG